MNNMKTRGRLAVVSALGVLMIAGSLLQATAASAATYTGRWNITAGSGARDFHTRTETTNRSHKISACVQVTRSEGGNWDYSYQLVWADGGQNKVIWHSGDHSGTLRSCSPVISLGGNDKVYIHIILFPMGGGESQAWGNWSIDTH